MLMTVLGGQGGELETLIRRAAQSVGTAQLVTRQQIGMYTRRIFDNLDWEKLEEELRELMEALREEGWSEEQLEQLQRDFEERKAAIRTQTRRYVEREQARRAGAASQSDRIKRLMNRPLSELDETELQLMREAVYQLARRLRNKLSLRDKRDKRGRLDVKTTLRRNMQHGGIPFDLVTKHKRKEKVELIVLCDVSSSVSRVSQFMLRFVYTIQDCLAKVRSFIFVDELGEVTEFFREESIEEGVRLALQEAEIVYYARSDFGSVFKQFCDRIPAGRRLPHLHPDHRRRPQQPERPLRRGAGEHGPARPGHHLAQPGAPPLLGHRRQRDGGLPPTPQGGAGLPQPGGAGAGHHQPAALRGRGRQLSIRTILYIAAILLLVVLTAYLARVAILQERRRRAARYAAVWWPRTPRNAWRPSAGSLRRWSRREARTGRPPHCRRRTRSATSCSTIITFPPGRRTSAPASRCSPHGRPRR